MSAESQFANVLPPEDGAILAITLDGTSRVYDLHAVDLGGGRGELGGTMFLTLRGDVKFWFKFNSANAGTCDETKADAAGAPVTFQADACIEVPANEAVRLRVSRIRHRYLIVKGSGAGKLRGWASSDISTR